MLSVFIRLLGYGKRLLNLPTTSSFLSVDTGDLTTYTLQNYESYLEHRGSVPAYEDRSDWRTLERPEHRWVPLIVSKGRCAVCDTTRYFFSDYKYANIVEGLKVPNWREQMFCLYCLLGNRQRAAYHLFVNHCLPDKSTAIYITEQHTVYYRMLKSRFPHTVGSEYLGTAVAPGEADRRGRRNENLCDLTFPDASFDTVLTYDVLEHIPDYMSAILEVYRVLKPGGHLMISVPFSPPSRDTIVRAKLDSDGVVEHILEPEYHGDPIKNKGCLCYYHFGWALLDDLRKAGFSDVGAIFYWSQKYGYLGGEQVMIYAKKPR